MVAVVTAWPIRCDGGLQDSCGHLTQLSRAAGTSDTVTDSEVELRRLLAHAGEEGKKMKRSYIVVFFYFFANVYADMETNMFVIHLPSLFAILNVI